MTSSFRLSTNDMDLFVDIVGDCLINIRNKAVYESLPPDLQHYMKEQIDGANNQLTSIGLPNVDIDTILDKQVLRVKLSQIIPANSTTPVQFDTWEQKSELEMKLRDKRSSILRLNGKAS